jgi:hypothetical protein
MGVSAGDSPLKKDTQKDSKDVTQGAEKKIVDSKARKVQAGEGAKVVCVCVCVCVCLRAKYFNS